jgi:methionyl-tRNA formyltransferase
VTVAAIQLGLNLHRPARVSSDEGIAALRLSSPEVMVVCAFGEVLSGEVLAVPRMGALNVHASLLPAYRGAAPIQRALMAGETKTGVTVQWMTEALDAGDVLLQRAVDVGPDENHGALSERLAELGASVVSESMALIAGGEAPRVAQLHEEATYAPSIRREEVFIDWSRTATELCRLIRAMSPRPGARTLRGGEQLKVLSAREGKNAGAERGIAGQVMELTSDGFWVTTGRGRLLALSVQPAGRRLMSAADYANGYRLRPGERLGG